jgi:hypothetical protein
MASLEEQILAMIEVCRSALMVPKRWRPRIDAQTREIARGILAQLKEYGPETAAMATINLDDRLLNWWELLYVMEAAERFLAVRLDGTSS